MPVGRFAGCGNRQRCLSHPYGLLVDMKEEALNGQVVNRVRVVAPTLSIAEATIEQLTERVQSTIRAEAVAEMRRREGTERVETVLQEDGLLSRRRVRSEVKTAVKLKELPNTTDGLRKGEISYDNARIIAGASQRGNIDETTHTCKGL